MGDIVAQGAMGKEDRVDIEYEIFTNLARYGDILILIVVMDCCNDIAGLRRDITAGKISTEHVTIFLSKYISKDAVDMKFSPDVDNPSNRFI